MAIYGHEHNHENPGEFEAACPVCELDEVSRQDTGRPYGWAARIIRHPSMAPTRKHFAANPLPEQKTRRTA